MNTVGERDWALRQVRRLPLLACVLSVSICVHLWFRLPVVGYGCGSLSHSETASTQLKPQMDSDEHRWGKRMGAPTSPSSPVVCLCSICVHLWFRLPVVGYGCG